jgi:hypothetical protein
MKPSEARFMLSCVGLAIETRCFAEFQRPCFPRPYSCAGLARRILLSALCPFVRLLKK